MNWSYEMIWYIPSLCIKRTPMRAVGMHGSTKIAPYISAWPRGSHINILRIFNINEVPLFTQHILKARYCHSCLSYIFVSPILFFLKMVVNCSFFDVPWSIGMPRTTTRSGSPAVCASIHVILRWTIFWSNWTRVKTSIRYEAEAK